MHLYVYDLYDLYDRVCDDFHAGMTQARQLATTSAERGSKAFEGFGARSTSSVLLNLGQRGHRLLTAHLSTAWQTKSFKRMSAILANEYKWRQAISICFVSLKKVLCLTPGSPSLAAIPGICEYVGVNVLL